MNLASLCARAVCLTVPERWPAGFHRARDEFAALGIDVRGLLNGPADRLPPPDPCVPPRYDVVPHPTGPPAGWSLPAGYWFHRWAVNLAVSRARDDGCGSLLILEDDVTLATDAVTTILGAVVPDDWDILYIGGFHRWGFYREVGPKVIKVDGSMGSFAVLLRDTIFEAVLNLPAGRAFDDQLARGLHPVVAAYALWPVAAIQAEAQSVITGKLNPDPSYYRDRGVNIAPDPYPSPDPGPGPSSSPIPQGSVGE